MAISTTGDEHRMGFLETCVRQWRSSLPLGSVIVVTVDGTEEDTRRALAVVDGSADSHVGGNTYRVGQGRPTRDDRQGVAVNKNTGIELLMEQGVEHLFLCDDDTWPLNAQALVKHTALAEHGVPHSMVCWGAHRLLACPGGRYATWSWPRGVLLYASRAVVETVGGMIEEFGPGGHEHVEWSRRIHQAGLTPDLYVTPLVYAEVGVVGRATRASSFWHCEDMRRRGEPLGNLRLRRRKLTTVRRKGEDWDFIEKIMNRRDGDTSYVGFRASENGRSSATLCSTSTGLGAGGEA